ncbi:unnamed protein product [Euphydryas editha]|uniref:JmjC domain-containing protein n=1 Tax=Euphydryas editha TaxID=104508 RepID=A0AAU9U6N2_EUPED|nr:unnamed protein product [Euphydryas editha]
MVSLDENLIRNLAVNSSSPIVFRKFVSDWPMCGWSQEKWTSVFGNKEIPFRCLTKKFISDEPCWERRCNLRSMTLKTFFDNLTTSNEWMYFDYKHLHQWFSGDSELCKEITWKKFGYPDKGAADTTLWIGNKGAHTPAHQDTYGYNIVAQVHGKKRWILFPPETGGLKPTRVPYEESSVYSELNFYCPNNLDVFKGLSGGGRMVELSAGDALLVPRGWWHYVQNIDDLNITLNIWLPHEKDNSTRVSEALIKILVAQICKDLPQETARLLVNPNEDDISDTPLAVLFLQLETVVNGYLDKKRKARRLKRQRTRDDPQGSDVEVADLKHLLDNHKNNLEIVPAITNDDLIELIKGNLKEYTGDGKAYDEDEVEGATSSLGLTKAVIDAFSQSNVIDLVKQNLFFKLG